MQPHSGYEQPPTGERWNVNMPAVIGVVFVFLVGVIVWVVATAGGDDAESGSATSTTVVGAVPVTGAPSNTTAVAPTTSPTPLPTSTPPSPPTTTPPTTAAPTTAAPTTTAAPATTAAPTTSTAPSPATTAPGAGPDAVPGDLAISGRPMRRPSCDGSYITIVASAIGGQATAVGIAAVLDDYPGTNYLRTDQTCPSLRASVGGEPIYVVYFGPFGDDDAACDARSDGPTGAYARQLSDEVGPDHSVNCPPIG